ncbi:MAG: 30S ribosomal protein S1 [Chloroflexota bacterium]
MNKPNSRQIYTPPAVDDAWWAALLAEEERYQPAQNIPQMLKMPPVEAEKAIQVNWPEAEQLYLQDETICMQVTGYNRGGLLVEGEGICGFVPISHLIDIEADLTDDERDAALSAYMGATLCLKIIECCPERGRVVLSQRAALAGAGQRNYLFNKLSMGDRISGVVTNVTDFGAFIDLGGVEGLVHVSELSWGRVRHPGDIVQVGRRIETMIINVDRERGRVALSLKRLRPNPWEKAEESYLPGQVVDAVITSVVSFGAFARLEDGLDGLIHMSALNGNHAQGHASQALAEGQAVRVRVLHVDAAKQRLGLGLCNE